MGNNLADPIPIPQKASRPGVPTVFTEARIGVEQHVGFLTLLRRIVAEATVGRLLVQCTPTGDGRRQPVLTGQDPLTGAPTPITGFMAAGTKIAAFAAMLRFLYVIGHSVQWELTPVMWTIIIFTMLVGTVLGLIQTDIKRMLAYSSIAHAGFILIGVTAYSQAAITSVVFYLLAYGLATVGAFGIVTLVREKDKDGNILGEATAISRWQGLGKTNPLLAGCMLIFLLSFAGIPLTSGFIGKFLVFSAGVAAGNAVLVVLAVLASAATAFFYFRLIVLMFFREPEGDNTAVIASEGFSIVAIVATAVITIVLGVFPGPILDFLTNTLVFML